MVNKWMGILFDFVNFFSHIRIDFNSWSIDGHFRSVSITTRAEYLNSVTWEKCSGGA